MLKVRFRSRLVHLCCLTTLLMISQGCGGNPDLKDGDPQYPVKGTVTLDGKPLESGAILLEPKDGKGIPVQGGVKDGKFELTAPAGTKVVRFNGGTRTTGKKDEYGADVTESIPIADKYSSQSELEVVITEGENNLPEYKITSK